VSAEASFDSREFDVRGPLPQGIWVLEASAGTGKTYTIAALAARYVAEGIPLDRMLLVTFTRMATGELRERVRSRLISVREGLDRVLAGVGEFIDDEVVMLLAAGDRAVVVGRRDRLARAVADFDAATIATTHRFCREVLSGLGIASGLEPDIAFVEDLRELGDEVLDDLYVRKFHRENDESLPFGQAAQIARLAIDNLAAEIVPATGDGPAATRVSLAHRVREELDRRKHGLAVITYDDLLTRLDDALRGRDGDVVAAQLRFRFEVVLVDEFQDTDPVQWDIMRLAFGAGRALILIADPKQAIYAFRGADVYSYLEAAETASSRATLRVNWRSDQGLIDAYDALFAGARLGHEGIEYRQVKAAPCHVEPRLLGAPVAAPLRFRVVKRSRVNVTATGYAERSSTREHIVRDVAQEIVALLDSDAELESRSPDGAQSPPQRVSPGHIAVLVATNHQAALVREALEAVQVPAVINGAGSVFETDPAHEWLRLLEALERPSVAARAHAAALTCFFGWSAERVATAPEADWEQLHQRLHDWARVLRSGGVAALVELMNTLEGLPKRLLGELDGERRLTDLRHVGQLLHAEAAGSGLGASALRAWLRSRIAEAREDTGDEERSRRLDSDAEAVQVLTIHRSKGLEFPIVHVPFLWMPSNTPRGDPPVFFHDPDAADARRIDVSLEGPAYREHVRQFVLEQRGEDLRLAYVALTRARHQAVVWWAAGWESQHSALGRLLFARDEQGNIAPYGARSAPTDAAVLERLGEVALAAPSRISIEDSILGAPGAWSQSRPNLGALVAAAFERDLDLRWRRTSYSDITAGAHDRRVSSEPEEPLLADEPDAPSPIPPAQAPPPDSPLAAPSLLGEMPFGADVGTFVHSVLEAADFAALDLETELDARIDAVRAVRGTDIGDPRVLRTGLAAALRTPLGPRLGGVRLSDVAHADRLDELAFELPLAGGQDPHGWLTLERFGAVLREHLGAGDPLAGYAERLADPVLRQRVRGYLTGSLDLVVRLPGPEGRRFLVCDYKTNWLGSPDEPLTAWQHRPAALSAEMQRRHYGLQALLYTVALHRYLRWRLPDHEPDRDIAGVAYLFLRGMLGAETPLVEEQPCGVFAWSPPPGLVAALSDLIDRGGPA
jgi:exodeoxyribonuclease V beta subunit